MVPNRSGGHTSGTRRSGRWRRIDHIRDPAMRLDIADIPASRWELELGRSAFIYLSRQFRRCFLWLRPNAGAAGGNSGIQRRHQPGLYGIDEFGRPGWHHWRIVGRMPGIDGIFRLFWTAALGPGHGSGVRDRIEQRNAMIARYELSGVAEVSTLRCAS